MCCGGSELWESGRSASEREAIKGHGRCQDMCVFYHTRYKLDWGLHCVVSVRVV